MADEKDLEIIEKMNEALQKQVEFRSKVLRLQGEAVDKQEEEIRLLRAKEQQSTIALEYLKATSDEIFRIKQAEEERLQKLVNKGVITKQQQQNELSLLNEIDDLKVKIEAGNEKEQEDAKKMLDLLEQRLTAQKKVTASILASKKATEGLVDTLGSLVGFRKDLDNTLTGNFIKAMSTGEGLKSLVKGIGTEIAATFGPANALQFFISNSIQVAKALDELQASFVAVTGASREFSTSIEEVFRENVQFGVSLQESADAIEGLYTNFGAFTSLNKATRNEIAGTTALLTELGVSASTTGDNFNFLVSQLGMSVSEAENTIRAFTETGAAIGIPPQQLNDAFRNLSPRLAAFGRQAPDIFMKTARTAKQLGFTVDELGNTMFALSEGLDTFQESASAVAAVNLSLGGSFVNAFDLTMAAAEGPAAQLDLLRDGFQAAGKTLSEMPFFQQKMLASELGLELGVLQQVIDGNMDSQQALAEENPLEELAKNANSAIDKLNQTLMSMSAGLQPLIGVMNVFAENIKGVTFAVVGLVTVTKGLAAAQTINTIATNAGVAANAGMLTKLVAAIKAKAALSAMNLSAAGSTGILTKMQLALNTAMMANPIGVIIAGVVALGGAIYGLVKNFDQVLAYMGGFFSDLGNMFNDLPSFMTAIARVIMLPFDAVWGVLAGVGQGIIDIINLFGADIPTPGFLSTSPSTYLMSLFDQGEVPGLAVGGTISSSGMAMVGEEGPELVNLPKGAQVVNNQSTTNLMKTMEETKVSNTTNTTANDGAMLQALLRIEKALNMQPAGTAGSSAQPINVSVQLDKKKVGEATVDYINKRYDVFTSN